MKHSFKEQTTRPLNNLELWRNQSRIKCQAAIFDFDITISEKPQAQAISEVPWLTQKLCTNYGIPFATVTHQHHLTSSLGIKNWPHKTGRVLENLWCQLQFVSKGLRTKTTSSTHIQVIISYQSSSRMILRCIKSDLRSHPSQLDIHHIPSSNSATCPTLLPTCFRGNWRSISEIVDCLKLIRSSWWGCWCMLQQGMSLWLSAWKYIVTRLLI